MQYEKKVNNVSDVKEDIETTVYYVESTNESYVKGVNDIKPTITYSIENISNKTVNWDTSSTTITFTGVKTYDNGVVEETDEYEIATFDKNEPIKNTAPIILNDSTFKGVDLGLNSGLLWSDRNLGAININEPGAYFSWGEIDGYLAPSDKFSSKEKNITHSFVWNGVNANSLIKQRGVEGGFFWSNYMLNGPTENNNSEVYDEEYTSSISGTVYPNGILTQDYDALYHHDIQKRGWRLPTVDEYKELWEGTTKAWVSKNVNGKTIYGTELTGKNGNKIFLPACGVATFNNIFGYGEIINMMTCQIWRDQTLSRTARFDKDFISGGFRYEDVISRQTALPIRGVRPK